MASTRSIAALPPRSLAIEAARAILAGFFEAAAVLDRDLRIAGHNSAYADMTGLAALTGVERDTALAAMEQGRGIHLSQRPITNVAGKNLSAWISFAPIFAEDGTVEGVFQIVRDVTAESDEQSRLRDLVALTRARADDLERTVQQRSEELRVALQEIARLSRTDPLTNLLNRRTFHEHAQQALDMAQRHERSLAILIFDLDYFKRVNDLHGHTAGDAVLRATSALLALNARQSDRVARIGGEEFAVLLSETSKEGAVSFAERLNQLIQEMPLFDIIPGASSPLTVSIGVAIYPEHGDTLDQLMSHADTALYSAKQRGRNTVVLFEPEMAACETCTSEVERPRVLLVVGDAETRSRYSAVLGDRYHVLAAENAAAASLFLGRDTNLDAIVVDDALPDKRGIELLGETVGHHPGAARLLIVESADFYLAMRGANLARVDRFLLKSEVEAKLADALEDGVAMREILRDRLAQSVGRNMRPPGTHFVERVLLERSLDFAFQPIIEATTSRPIGVEALCRLPKRFALGPQDLFDAAMRSGLIWRLGRLVRETILEHAMAIEPHLILFLNMHPAELEDPDLFAKDNPLHAIADRIVLEITERAAIPDLDRFRGRLSELRQHGYRFAIDDLGAGYASLSAVALLEPDVIKLDRLLITAGSTSGRRKALLRRIVDFAREQEIRVVAEGIETEAERAFAKEIGCDLMQGYLLGRPRMCRIE